ncbi:hypothetical protein LSAT2_008402 [Lamellibrachia satsuma]|nr:hypothetical protein LSAT2_008402 [Lamellibrachia satsuma]
MAANATITSQQDTRGRGSLRQSVGQGQLSGNVSAKAIPHFPSPTKKERKMTTESINSTSSDLNRASLPPMASPGKTFVRGSDGSRDYRLDSQALYMGRNSFPHAYVPALGPWQVPTGNQMRHIMSRVTRPTEASESRDRECAFQRYSVHSAKTQDMAADVGMQQYQYSRRRTNTKSM